MKFGMNLLLWTDTLKDEMLPVLKQLKKLGYDGVEIPIFDFEAPKYERWGKILSDLGLGCTAVTCRGGDDNPISSDAAIRAKGVENNKRVLDCCHAAGATVLVGPYHSAIGVFSGAGPTDDEFNWGVDSMRQVAEHAQQAGVMLGIEYLNRFETYLLTSAEQAVKFVKAVKHPYCRMMYDTFHANVEEKDLSAAIRTASKYMVHVHIPENDRSTPGAGHVDWKTTFDTLKEVGYDGYLMIEAFGMALPAIAAATKIWRRMFKSEMQLAKDGLAFMQSQWAARAKPAKAKAAMKPTTLKAATKATSSKPAPKAKTPAKSNGKR
jgi:D-psicose/D-tagatose/L-ribulose 3-epimerase